MISGAEPEQSTADREMVRHRELYLAILAQGIESAYATDIWPAGVEPSQRRHVPEIRQTERDWIAGTLEGSSVTFEYCCEVLNINPTSLRRAIEMDAPAIVKRLKSTYYRYNHQKRVDVQEVV